MTNVLTNVMTSCNDTHMTTSDFGTTVHGNEFTSRLRGIQAHDGIFTAITAADSREFKTLAGAVRFMARYGFDAHGRRIAQ